MVCMYFFFLFPTYFGFTRRKRARLSHGIPRGVRVCSLCVVMAQLAPADAMCGLRGGLEEARLRLLRELALNRREDLAALADLAERGAPLDGVLELCGGRAFLAARANDGVAALEILRHVAGLPAPPRASAKRKLGAVVACGDWVPEDATEIAWEAARYDVGGGEVVEIEQCAKNYFCSGCRVWSSSVALARHLRATPADGLVGLDVLELGAGVGLVARVARTYLLAGSVTATDREARLLGLLARNAPGCAVAELDWSDPPTAIRSRHAAVDVVLGADLVYSSGAVPAGLLAAVACLLRSGGRLLLCVPDGRHGLAELLGCLRADARFESVGCAPVDRGLLADLEDHPFLLVRATRAAHLPIAS